MKNVIFNFLAILIPFFFLFGCGSGSKNSSSKKNENFQIVTKVPSNILVAEGMKKDILLRTNAKNATFKFVGDIGSTNVSINDLGIVIYRTDRAIGVIEDVTVVATNSNGEKSEPVRLVFKTVSRDIKPTINIGLQRVYKKDNEGNLIDVYGNIWENQLGKKSIKNQLYLIAENRCATLQLMHKGSKWRVPTSDEMLSLVDYTAIASDTVLDSAFDKNSSTFPVWVQPKDGEYQVFSQSNGLILKVKPLDKFAVRCINSGVKEVERHIISTDRISDFTYDFTTGLMWSEMTESSIKKIDDGVGTPAQDYCTQLDNSSGWRFPNINELFSIVDDGTISTSIRRRNSIIVSSTSYNNPNPNNNTRASNYYLGIENGKVVTGVSYADMLYPITCVKEIP